MGRNFSIASKKHQNDFDVLVIVRKRLKNGIAISFLELSTVAPKPRAEGSSPSAPASISVDNGLKLSTLIFYSISSGLCGEWVSYLLTFSFMRI